METCSVVLTFESVDEILWCDLSNETSSAVLLHNTCNTTTQHLHSTTLLYFFLNILQNEIWNFSIICLFGTLGSLKG